MESRHSGRQRRSASTKHLEVTQRLLAYRSPITSASDLLRVNPTYSDPKNVKPSSLPSLPSVQKNAFTGFCVFSCLFVANAIRSLRPCAPFCFKARSAISYARSSVRSEVLAHQRTPKTGGGVSVRNRTKTSAFVHTPSPCLPTSHLCPPSSDRCFRPSISAYAHLHLLASSCTNLQEKNCANQCSRRSSDLGFPLLPLRSPVQKSAFSGFPALLFDSCAPRHERCSLLVRLYA